MSEDRTQDQDGKRPFEERVLKRLDSIDARLSALEEQAERRAMETKPIWERALAEIAMTRQEMHAKFEDFDVRFDRVESVVNATRSEMLTLRADFKEFRAGFKEPA